MRTMFRLPIALVLGMLVAPVVAHHSAAPLFDIKALESHAGVVTEVWFYNPHVRYYVNTAGEGQDPQIWEVETHNRNRMFADGWDETTVQVGDRVGFSGHPARNGARSVLVRIMSKDGAEIMRWETGPGGSADLSPKSGNP